MNTQKLIDDLKVINKESKDKSFVIRMLDHNLVLSYFADNEGEIVVKDYLLIEAADFDHNFNVCFSAKMFNQIVKLLDKQYDLSQRIYANKYHLIIVSGNSQTQLDNNLTGRWSMFLDELGISELSPSIEQTEETNLPTSTEAITETTEPVVEPIVETVVETVVEPVVETVVETEIPLKTSIRETIIEVSKVLVTLDGIKVELVGQWLWITGETYKHKETIKKLGFFWSRNKQAWYKAFVKSYSKKHYKLDEIKLKHGAININSLIS